jgi:hypothetical protein
LLRISPSASYGLRAGFEVNTQTRPMALELASSKGASLLPAEVCQPLDYPALHRLAEG